MYLPLMFLARKQILSKSFKFYRIQFPEDNLSDALMMKMIIIIVIIE